MNRIIVVRFPGKSRNTYDYFDETGEPVSVGSIVEVPTRHGHAFVEVVDINPRRRNFAEKRIVRVLTDIEAAAHRDPLV